MVDFQKQIQLIVYIFYGESNMRGVTFPRTLTFKTLQVNFKRTKLFMIQKRFLKKNMKN